MKAQEWQAIHGASGASYSGTESACKAWARERDGAQVLHNGYVYWFACFGRLKRV